MNSMLNNSSRERFFYAIVSPNPKDFLDGACTFGIFMRQIVKLNLFFFVFAKLSRNRLCGCVDCVLC